VKPVPETAKIEPAKVESAAAIESGTPVETAGAELPPAPEPVATPAPEPPKITIAPPPLTTYEEPPQPVTPFITPRIQIQRMAPPLLFAAKETFAAAPEVPAQELAEAKIPPLVEQQVAASPPTAIAEPTAPDETTVVLNPVVKTLIITDGKLDTRKTVEHIVLLPGVNAAALTIKGKTKTAGAVPEDFHAQEIGKAASLLFQALESHAPKNPPGTPRSITLHHHQFSSTYFKQNGITLCILHPQRSLDAEPHHAVLLVLQEIARLRQP
jgi:hypothetical protein